MTEPTPAGDDNSISALFSRLIDDAEGFVRAEIRLYRAQALARISSAKWALMMGAAAMLLAQSATVAGLVGLLLTLRRPLGPGVATLIVVGGSLLVAVLLAGLAWNRIKKLTDLGEDPQ